MVKYRDKKMEKYVKERKFVPCGLPPNTGKLKEGHYYWSGKAGMYYKVIEVFEEDREAKIIWQNKKYAFIYCRPNIWIDYEVKGFEWKSTESPVGKNVSLTYNEIKALNCAGVIKKDILNSSWTPKGHLYYFIEEDETGSLYLNRDLKKSPRKEQANEGI